MSGAAFWIIQAPGWILFAYLAVAQCPSAISYRLGVRMGTQEPAEKITEIGVALFWAFAFSDLVFYTPLLGIGLLGHALGAEWGALLLAAALGITVYWPVVCLATVRRARGAPGWMLPKEGQYWVVLPIIAGWATLSLLLLVLGGA